jgi:hypothetical protein
MPTALSPYRELVNRVALPFVLMGMLLYAISSLILGENSFIAVHDNLDGEFVYRHLLVTTGTAFSYGGDVVIENVMNGLPRSALRSGFDVSLLLLYVFSPHMAYLVNQVLVSLIGFAGMYLLLRRHFVKGEEHRWLIVTVAFCFFLTPYYSTFGASVAGQPLLLYAFLNIREERSKWTDYAIIVLFPFYSHLVLVALFIILALAVIGMIDLIANRRLNLRFFLAIALLAGMYLLVESQLVYSTFVDQSFVSHRSTWNRWVDEGVNSSLKRSTGLLFESQYHAGRFPTLLIILTAAVSLLFVARDKVDRTRMIGIGIGIVVICLIFGFHGWLIQPFSRHIDMLRYFNTGRFYFLLPLLWMLLFAISLKAINERKSLWPVAIVLCLGQTALVVAHDDELKNNVRLIFDRKIGAPTYAEFFSRELFAEIDQHIGRPKHSYRVVSIGMHPSIAQFNGFHTLDGYQVNFPLEYKNRFRRIIARELEKNEVLREYFDGWGNRCYVFVAELGKRQDGTPIDNLELDTLALKDLGGEYIFSANEIRNHVSNSLTLEKVFMRKDGGRPIYLYKVL